MSGTLTVVNPGALSLVQDSGRQGFQRYGVSVSGAVDPEALLIGNLLVDNLDDAAAIEITFGGAEFRFEQETIAAITGADLQLTLDGIPVPLWESFLAPAGSTLRFAAPVSGLRSYLSCAGGIDTEPVLGSRSTHIGSGLGGLNGGPLKPGDELPLGDPSEDAAPSRSLPLDLRIPPANEISVRVVLGPQDDAFTADGIDTFFSSPYTVTDKSDRQGVRLDGPQIESADGRYDIVSDAVPFGSIQVPGDGMPIVLLSDRQTTGGYTKIGVVAFADLPKLAQAMPGSVVHFEKVSASEAQAALRERRSALLDADLDDGASEWSGSLGVNGRAASIRLSYRSEEIRESGELIGLVVDGVSVAVHAKEVSD